MGIYSSKNYNDLFIGNGNYKNRNIDKIIKCLKELHLKYKVQYTLN